MSNILTGHRIDAAKPKEKAYKIADGTGMGLYIFVTPAGNKIWRMNYRTQCGVSKTLTIGHWPKISITEARAEAVRVKEILAAGRDPMDKGPGPGAPFRTVACDWHERQKGNWDPVHARTVLYRLERYIFPYIGDRPVNEIKPTDILSFLRQLEAHGKVETAKRVNGICSQVFRFAVASGLAESDPCRDLRGALTVARSKPRAAIISREGIQELVKAMNEYTGSIIVKSALWWAALTLARSGEVRLAEWTEIDDVNALWKVPARRMKSRQEHWVPLSRQCLRILEDLRKMNLPGKLIFPGLINGKCISDATLLLALRRMGFAKDEMSVHGFRSMASSQLNEQGFRSDVIEKALAHTDGNKVRAVYNRTEYMNERRDMLQHWADWLDELVRDAPAPLPKGATMAASTSRQEYWKRDFAEYMKAWNRQKSSAPNS